MRVCPRCRSIYSTRTAFCGIDGEKLHDQVADPLVGRTVGRYRVADKLGVGSTGCVYKAVHQELETDFALKVLFGDLGANETIVARFRREAQAASRIRSPYVVSVMDFGSTDEGLVYYVMEYSPGRTLQDLLRDHGALGAVRASRILGQLARGLDAAHALGFVHRDIKPANIVLAIHQGRETAKILDFGIVRQTDDDQDTTKLTRDGLVVGTPAYMSPEQAMGVSITPAADLYSLGVVLFEMLEGARPFKARSVAEMVLKHSEFPPPEMGDHGGLEKVATRLLEKNPAARYESASAVIDAVAELEVYLKTRDERPPRADSALQTRTDDAPSNPQTGSNPVSVSAPNPPTDGQLTTSYMPVNRGLLVAAIVGALVAVFTVGVALFSPETLSGSQVEVLKVPPPPPPPPPVKPVVPTNQALIGRLDKLDGKLATVEGKVGPDRLKVLKSTYLDFYKTLGREPSEDERAGINKSIDGFEAELDALLGS